MVKTKVVPVPLQSLTECPKEIWGGKAHGLWHLTKGGYTVPLTWVIPTEYCAKKPLTLDVDLSFVIPRKRYAVRSGAPISMPGLLDTKLNITKGKMARAIRDVWKSWNSDHARAHRDAKDIPDSMGTAVCIQEMVNPHCSGVAFTCDPSDSANTEFDPIIEYVDGLGDKLVGGAHSGSALEEWRWFYYSLRGQLEAIHSVHGPSDVEWVVSKQNVLYFVQHRAIKFTKEVISEAAEHEKDKVILRHANSIGAKVYASGAVKLPELVHPGDIVLLNEFKPEYYKAMLTSSGIISMHGGNTCHAAITARDMNKPAISGIYPAELLGKKVVLSGVTGKVLEYYDLPVDENVIEVVKPKYVPPVPNFLVRWGKSTIELWLNAPEEQKASWLKPSLRYRWEAQGLLFRFYKALNDAATGVITAERKDEIVNEIAHIFATYTYSITLGELRHTITCVTLKTQKLFDDMCAIYDLGVPVNFQLRSKNHLSIGSPCREDFIHDGIPQPPSVEIAAEIMRLTTAIFNAPTWHKGMGGPKWGVISNITHQYLAGQLSPTLFVDSVMNLQHNGGRMYNKVNWFQEGANLAGCLDAKAKSFNKLWHKITSKDQAYVQQDRLLHPAQYLAIEVSQPAKSTFLNGDDTPKEEVIATFFKEQPMLELIKQTTTKGICYCNGIFKLPKEVYKDPPSYKDMCCNCGQYSVKWVATNYKGFAEKVKELCGNIPWESEVFEVAEEAEEEATEEGTIIEPSIELELTAGH